MSLFPSGPELPAFSSLVVKGPYHASAPVHLALSTAQKHPNTRIVMIAPSREAMAAALKEQNDSWMSTHSGTGSVLELSECTMLYYPPTPAHCAYLLSTLSTNPENADPKTLLYRPPSLIVLLEPSAYFAADVEANPNCHSWTMASYMSLVARALAAVASLSAPANEMSDDPKCNLSLALFDSRLDSLTLPIVKHPTSEDSKPSRAEPIASVAEKYFELVAVFEEDDLVLNSSQEEENLEINRTQWNRLQIFREYTLVGTVRWSERVDGLTGGVVFDH